ncbi:MAG: hypothetical protein ABJD24_07825, partial [Acidimicrobiales bacterium]
MRKHSSSGRDTGDGKPSKEELEAAYCWEKEDEVPRRPAMTAFRRRTRYHQAKWREANNHPIGSQPIAPKPGAGASRPVGNRLPLAYAKETGANFLTPAALKAARARTSISEPHQSFDHQRLWTELLWSPSMAFNLFGDLAANLARADRAVHTWWPDAPGAVSDVRFAHSPSRFDMSYTGNLIAFDAAFVLDIGDGTQAIVALDTSYHDKIRSAIPKPIRLGRYLQITRRSGVFGPQAIKAVNGTKLTVMWLEHLLLLSMLQHPSGNWPWGRYVVVYPEGNVDYAEACAQYRDLLVDQSTFSSMTMEELLDANVLPAKSKAALRARYLP